MSDEHRKTQEKSSLNKPFLLGYSVRPAGDGDKSYWSKISVAWAHKDGQGFNVQMDAMPIDGKLVLRTVPDDQDHGGELYEPAPM